MSFVVRLISSPYCIICIIVIVTMIMVARDNGNLTDITTGGFNQLNEVYKDFSYNKKAKSSNIIRILCYGDSLTAGTSPPLRGHYPYAPYLQTALNEDHHEVTTSTATEASQGTNKKSSSNDYHYIVKHRGYPGFTASMMVDRLNDTIKGIQPVIEEESTLPPPVSIVVILTGTNDVGLETDPYEIAKSIITLHRVALSMDGVQKTVAVGIPPSAHQAYDANAKRLAHRVNSYLEEFATKKTYNQMIYVPFPFHYSVSENKYALDHNNYQGKGSNWATDGIHLSKIGYQILGESLAPVIKSIVRRKDYIKTTPQP